MKFNIAAYQCLILFHCARFIISKNYYSVIAPGTIKSNRKYSVAVTLHESEAPCIIRITIMGRSFNATNQAQLQPYQTKSLEFFPPKLENDNYKLVAEGLGGCDFTNQTELIVQGSAGPKIYIQTDKSYYKPLDLIKFRVVILDEHTRPVNIREPIRIEIFDNDQNRVKQFKDIALTKGVFTGQLQLSQQPVMGKWEIRATISGRYSHQGSKIISVLMYTLPKFNVYLEAPSVLRFPDLTIVAEIYGKYTFDKYVEGTLVVELRAYEGDVPLDRKVLQIQGLVIVEFKLANEQVLEGVDYMIITANLQEKHTGISQNISHSIIKREQSFRIIILDDEMDFRNNIPFRLKAIVDDWSGVPVWDQKTPITLEHGGRIYQTYLNEEGEAIFEFEHKRNAKFTVRYKNSMQIMPSIYVPEKSSVEDETPIYCTLRLKDRLRLGKPVEIEVRSSFNIPYLVYTVVGPANKKLYTIEIIPSTEMIPYSFLYVHYVTDGQLRYQEMKLTFPMELENEISVKAPQKVRPGQEVTLTLKAQPKSYVSIMAVDLSVYLLDSKYDIYKTTIFEDLLDDKTYLPIRGIWIPGIISDLMTLTNAEYPIIFMDKYIDTYV